jgi:hypothetical protein
MINDRARTDPPLRLLPKAAADLLRAHRAPPRLVAHRRCVHDVAAQIVEWVDYPVDREAVLFGAAAQDIEEGLSDPGRVTDGVLRLPERGAVRVAPAA